MGISFPLTNTKYDEKTFAAYMPSGWYKNLWRFMSTPIFDLEVTENYKDMPILCKIDAYLMEVFVDGGFRNVNLKARPPEDICNTLIEGMRNGTASIVPDESLERNSFIGQAGTLAVIVIPSTTCQPQN